jgi:hypothetical protein
MEKNLNLADQTSVKGYLDSLIADEVQQGINAEVAVLHQENVDIEGFLGAIVQDTTLKQRAAEIVSEIMADNVIKLHKLLPKFNGAAIPNV